MIIGKLATIVFAAGVGLTSGQARAIGVRELSAPDLPDTAMAEMTPGGPVIYYNPALFQAAGDARDFVRAHEWGHVLLGHLEDPWKIDTDAGRAEAEAEADCFAAHNTSRETAAAMARLVQSLPPEPRDAIYGTKPERARRILACAGISKLSGR